MCKTVLLLLFILISVYEGQANQPVTLRGPPIVEKEPLLLNSFLPASMQVIAHVTDLMKYEIHPVSGVTTTTTIRPTPSHKPAIYAPSNAPGAAAYYARGSSYQEYVERLKNSPGLSYFDRYLYPAEHSEESYHNKNNQNTRAKVFQSLGGDDLDLLGKEFTDLLKEVNTIEDNANNIDDNERAERFSAKYDQDYIIGNKKIPPTRAYVTMLSLYDLLNKETKKLQLSKYGGYTPEVLNILRETSSGSSANQLRVVISKLVEKRDTRDQQIINKLKTLITDLDQTGSYINDALRFIPPLVYFI